MYWAVLSQSTISKIRSDKPLVLEPTPRSISNHTYGSQPTMQRILIARQRTILRSKQCEMFLSCLAHTYSLSLYTYLLQLSSTHLTSTHLASTQLPYKQLPATRLPSMQLNSTLLPSALLTSTGPSFQHSKQKWYNTTQHSGLELTWRTGEEVARAVSC